MPQFRGCAVGNSLTVSRSLLRKYQYRGRCTSFQSTTPPVRLQGNAAWRELTNARQCGPDGQVGPWWSYLQECRHGRCPVDARAMCAPGEPSSFPQSQLSLPPSVNQLLQVPVHVPHQRALRGRPCVRLQRVVRLPSKPTTELR